MATSNSLNESSESTDDVKMHAARKFYDISANVNSQRSFPVKRQNDPEALFRYLDQNIIGNGYKFISPFGQQSALYCDYTASGKAVKFIEDYIQNEVLPAYGNTHTTTSVTSLQTTLYRHEARDIIRNAVNASEYDCVVFIGSGATGAVHKLIHSMQLDKPVVFVGPFEHHSNLLPWREIAADVIRIPQNSIGHVDIDILQTHLLKYEKCGRQLIGCFSAASNITGIICDVDAISALLHKHGAYVFWDYASAAPYMKIDMNPVSTNADSGLTHKDAVFISTHKFLGGVDAPGILIAKKSLFKNPVPSGSGGGTIFFVNREDHRYLQDVETREEGGTPAIVGCIRAGLAFQMKEAVTSQAILKRDQQIVRKVIDRWKSTENLVLLGNEEADKLPIFSFVVKHEASGLLLHHNFVSAILNDVFGIQCRGGCACAAPYALDLLGIDQSLARLIENTIAEDSRLDRVHLRRKEEHSHREVLRPGFVRLNLPYFMNEDDIEYVIEAVKLTCVHGWKLLPQYIVNPETGEWKHQMNLVMKDRKWLGSISYNNGIFSYSDEANSEVHDKAMNNNDRIERAMQIFESASKVSLKRKLPDQSIIFDEESRKLRSFLLPSEAQAFLAGKPMQCHQIPYFPVKYPLKPADIVQNSTVDTEQAIADGISGPKNCDHDEVDTLLANLLNSILNEVKDGCHGDSAVEATVKTSLDGVKKEILKLMDAKTKEVKTVEQSDVIGGKVCDVKPDSKWLKEPDLKAHSKKKERLWCSPPKSIMKTTIEAIEKFQMIKDKDRILVCLSGGKDSLTLLHVMHQYQFIARHKNINFEFGAVTVDPQTESYNPSSLKEYLAKLGVPYFYEEQCIIDQAAALPEQCTSICSFCSRMKRGRIYACARREGYNVLALGQHIDDLAESFFMSLFHNGRLGTMKAHYTVKEGDLRVIRPFAFTREELFRQFAVKNRLPVIAENCPACFESPKERHRIKQLLASQEVLFPKLYWSLKSAMLPIISIDKTGIDGRSLFFENQDDSD